MAACSVLSAGSLVSLIRTEVAAVKSQRAMCFGTLITQLGLACSALLSSVREQKHQRYCRRGAHLYLPAVACKYVHAMDLIKP
jgi:hypothetical protein